MMKFFEKLLPNQLENSRLYKGPMNIEEEIQVLVEKFLINKEYSDHSAIKQPEMGSNVVMQGFIKFILRQIKVKKALEIGTFTGRTTIEIASVNNKVIVDTIEKFSEFGEVARENFVKHGVNNRISLHIGDAKEIMPTLKSGYDFIFIDGDKEHYLNYLEQSLELISDGGIVAIDDIFFHGDIFNKNPESLKGVGVKKVVDYLLINKESIRATFLPISNGLVLIEKI